MVVGGILAGGIGSRMGGDIPKQFLNVGGIPIIVRVIKKFFDNDVDRIIVAMNPEWVEYCHKLLAEWEISKNNLDIIVGGKTRFESLTNIAQKAKEYDDNAVVISHDCARVFVSDNIIKKNIEMIKHMTCVTTSVPTIDTVLVSESGTESSCVPKRETIFLDQGPQTFYASEFLKLVEKLSGNEKQKYMEAGRLYIDNNLKVFIAEGERTNFKMTTDFDMKFGEYLIAEGYVK